MQIWHGFMGLKQVPLIGQFEGMQKDSLMILCFLLVSKRLQS